MQVILTTTIWMVSFASTFSYTATTLPDIDNENFIKECVHIHNKFRSKVNPPATNMLYMTWEPALAQTAKAWAKYCQFGHNLQRKLNSNFTSVGENIWTGSLSLFSVSSAVSGWYNEIQYYDFSTPKCTRACDHYTQVVWADSYKVGCAVQFCPKVSGFEKLSNAAHFICNYGPGGNYPSWPYKKGAKCSACPQSDKCLENLCINPQRDKVTRYYSVDYPEWAIYIRNRYTSLFLIVKSIILILSVIMTIFIKHKYPNLVILD